MYQRSFFNVLLFMASMIITGALIFGISGCTPQEKKTEPVQQTTQSEPASLPPVPVNLPISVDFNNVPLSEVAQFITSQTGKGLILSGNEAKPLSWVESNLAKETLFDSFKAAVTASGLVLQPANDQETLFTVTQPEEPKTPVLLDFAQSSKGVFFLLGSTIYPLEKFPYPVRYDSGHWYALLPKSISDQKKSSSETEKL